MPWRTEESLPDSFIYTCSNSPHLSYHPLLKAFSFMVASSCSGLCFLSTLIVHHSPFCHACSCFVLLHLILSKSAQYFVGYSGCAARCISVSKYFFLWRGLCCANYVSLLYSVNSNSSLSSHQPQRSSTTLVVWDFLYYSDEAILGLSPMAALSSLTVSLGLERHLPESYLFSSINVCCIWI